MLGLIHENLFFTSGRLKIWRILFKSVSERESYHSNFMAAMDPIDITSSSDSDFDFEDDGELDASPVRESVAPANSRVLPQWASTSGTNSKGTSK